jgi:hypothetical protein
MHHIGFNTLELNFLITTVAFSGSFVLNFIETCRVNDCVFVHSFVPDYVVWGHSKTREKKNGHHDVLFGCGESNPGVP